MHNLMNKVVMETVFDQLGQGTRLPLGASETGGERRPRRPRVKLRMRRIVAVWGRLRQAVNPSAGIDGARKTLSIVGSHVISTQGPWRWLLGSARLTAC
jgi:hypothetical protein